MATAVPALTDSGGEGSGSDEKGADEKGADGKGDVVSGAADSGDATADSRGVVTEQAESEPDADPDPEPDPEQADAVAGEPADARDEDPVAAEPDPSTPLTRRRKIWAAAMAVGLILAVAGGLWAGLLQRDHRDVLAAQQRDAEIVATTRQMVTNLVTLGYRTAADDVRRIKAGTTGDFRKQFDDTTGSFAAILNQGKVESSGTATSVALVSADDHTAVAIGAVTSTVKNSAAPDGQQRVYRMKVDLTNIDGKWLVSNMEFVS